MLIMLLRVLDRQDGILIFVYKLTDADLGTTAGFMNQQIAAAVPEADGYAMLVAGLGLIGFVLRRLQ